MAGHAEDQEDRLCCSKDLLPYPRHAQWSQQYFSSICHRMYTRVRLLELSNDIASVSCQCAQTSDEYDATDQTNFCDDGGKREDAEGDGLSDLWKDS